MIGKIMPVDWSNPLPAASSGRPSCFPVKLGSFPIRWLRQSLALASVAEGGHLLALIRVFAITAAICPIGCRKPGLDELQHAKPTQAERSVAQANWDKLELAFQEKDFDSARALIGKPIVFFADVDYCGTQVTGRRTRTFSDSEEAQLSKLSASERREGVINRVKALPKVPCRWGLTRLQKRTIHSCHSLGLEVLAR
jgi:hypothetical protein